jgi:hypothetical protein
MLTRCRPRYFGLWTCSLLVLLALIKSYPASAEGGLQEYYDRDYGYVFQYPDSWKLQALPEGDANRDIRLLLQGTEGSSFMVVIDKTKTILKKTDFENSAEQTQRVGAMMEQIITQIYQSISESIKAVNMKVGERRDLSNEFGIKFYIATLNEIKNGKPIIVAGIHAFPFNKDYSVNFTMTTFYDPAATQEHQRLTEVFNSFRLIGEPQAGNGLPKPPTAKEPQ